MKTIKKELQTHNIRFNQNRPGPENKDNLDSREHEEQIFKGDDLTHNVKDHHTKPNRKKEVDIKQNL